MRLEIECTEQDCSEAIRRHAFFCVVSTAIQRLLPEATRIDTTIPTIRFSLVGSDGKRRRYVYPMPDVVRRYVQRFDAGEEPLPMTFILDEPRVTEMGQRDPRAAKTATFRANSRVGRGSPTNRRIFGARAKAAT